MRYINLRFTYLLTYLLHNHTPLKLAQCKSHGPTAKLIASRCC